MRMNSHCDAFTTRGGELTFQRIDVMLKRCGNPFNKTKQQQRLMSLPRGILFHRIQRKQVIAIHCFTDTITGK